MQPAYNVAHPADFATRSNFTRPIGKYFSFSSSLHSFLSRFDEEISRNKAIAKQANYERRTKKYLIYDFVSSVRVFARNKAIRASNRIRLASDSTESTKMWAIV
jgi:hypothetical protein